VLRALSFAVALLVSACAAVDPSATPTPSPTRDPTALNVTALLDLSGSRAPHGGPQRDALQLWADQHATSTPRVRLRIVDVAGSRTKTVLEFRRAAVDERADAIVIGATVEYDEAFASAVQLAQVPVLFTLPIPEPAVAGGGWAFALAPTPAQLARATVDDAVARGTLSGSVIVSDESPSAISDRAALTAELARRGASPTLIKVTGSDATQRLRAVLPSTRVAFFAGAPRAYAEAARTSASGTLLYLSYVCDMSDFAELRDAAASAAWPGSRWVAAPATSGSVGRIAFIASYTDRAGPPTTPAASAFDALTLILSAASGGIEPARMRDRLQAQRFGGVATTYSFSASRRAGFAIGDLVMLRYTSARAAPMVR
jgi:hypothetical protein